MASAIQLGNFFTSGGKTVSGGSASGIDTKSLLEGLVAAKSIPKTNAEDKIKVNDTKVTAIDQLKTKLTALQDAANFLRNPPGVSNQSSNVFQFTKASVSSNTTVAGSNYVSVTSSAGANYQSYSIENITSVAAAKKQSTGDFLIADADTSAVTSSATAGFIKAGTVTIQGKAITFTTGDTLNTVVSKINQVSDDTGINATVLKVSSGHFRIVFSATDTGSAANFNLGDSGDVTPSSISDPSAVLSNLTFDTVQDAANAEFEFEGVPIIRQTNNISDLVDGVTFTIQQETPLNTVITAAITPDTATVKGAVANFLNAYNDLKTFYAKQTKVGADGVPDKDAVLNQDTVMRAVMNQASNEMTSIVSGLSGDYTRLADLGITLTDLPETADTPKVSNIMTLDESKLDTALASNFSDVSKIFGFSFAADNADLGIYSRTNATTVNSFTLDVTYLRPKIQQSSAFSIADADQPVVAASATPGMFTAGTVTINGAAITLADGDTLNTVIGKFNAVKATTGIQASLTPITVGSYAITFTALTSGTEGDFDLGSSSDVSDPGLVFQNVTYSNTQTATDTKATATYTNASNQTVTINLDLTKVTDDSYSISGQKGTVLEGLVMVYGNTAASIHVTLTQGIADRVYNIADGATKTDTGLLAGDTKSLQDDTTRLKESISRMELDIETFRQQLLDKFAAMEKAITQVNSLLAQLTAQQDARNNANG